MPEPRTLASVVGVDVGGTKTHVIAVAGGVRDELVVPSAQWRRGSLFSDDGNLPRLAALIAGLTAVDAGTSVVVGMHGCDSPAQARTATDALREALGADVHVANDAELLGWAADEPESLRMIVGTGAVIVGTTADGEAISAAGHGWLLSDDGSAPALVRDALRLLLQRSDEGERDDPLAPALMDAFGAEDLTTLALAATDTAGLTAWGTHAHLIFAAAESGSHVATEVIDAAGARLASNAVALSRRGAAGSTIVAAGGVIVNQPRLQSAVHEGLARLGSPLGLRVLTAPPAEGAVAWARHRARARQTAAL